MSGIWWEGHKCPKCGATTIECTCECGGKWEGLSAQVITGKTKSCGCLKRRVIEETFRKAFFCKHCGKKHFAKGLCRNCYERHRRHGTVELKQTTQRKCAKCGDDYYAKNMCKKCYNKQRYNELKNKTNEEVRYE